MKQLSAEDIIKHKTRIGECLVALKSEYFSMACPPEEEVPSLADYFPNWRFPKNIPHDQLEMVSNALQGEVKILQQFGTEAYFKTITIDAKLDIYETALIGAALVIEKQYREKEEPITWLELKKIIYSQMATILSSLAAP